MKILKIILGFGLVYAVGSEYARASRELGTYNLPTILALATVVMLLSSWLIGSGFSRAKFRFKSIQALLGLIASLITFVFALFIGAISHQPEADSVSINGISVDIGPCMSSNRMVVQDPAERLEFCTCLLEKISTSKTVVEQNSKLLEFGQIDKIIDSAKANGYFDEIESEIESCLTFIELKWTDAFAEGMKVNMKSQLEGVEFTESIYLDAFCDCVISAYGAYPLSRVISEDFADSDEAIAIEERCILENVK